jgi:hypothetical protein
MFVVCNSKIKAKKLALPKRDKRVVSLPSPEGRNRYSFQNVVFSSYAQLRKMDKVQKPSDSECYTPMLEPFRFYKTNAV